MFQKQRRKPAKEMTPINDIRKDVTSGDENRERIENTAEENYENYQYQPYRAKNAKAVDFTNEVSVVYFNADEVVGESKEPLKKELDQQIRNKEMRKGHFPTLMVGNRKAEEYNLHLFKK